MSPKAKKIIHACYGIALSLLILAVSVASILLCIEIYKSGNRPFSRESIAAAFDRIDVLVYTTLLTALGGIALSIVLPLEAARPKAMRDEYETLKSLRAKVGSAVPGTEPKRRLSLRVGLAVATVLLFLWPIADLCDTSRYGLENLNRDVIRGVLPSLVSAGIMILLATLCSHLAHRSVQREIAACKTALAEGRTAPQDETHESKSDAIRDALKKNEWTTVVVIRAVILLLAVAFIVLGILNGGIDDVLGKAIRICTECIGLG